MGTPWRSRGVTTTVRIVRSLRPEAPYARVFRTRLRCQVGDVDRPSLDNRPAEERRGVIWSPRAA